MIYHNNILCCTAKEIINVSSESIYKNMLQRKQMIRVRRACTGNVALIEYESLPEKYKKMIVELNKDSFVFKKGKTFSEEITLDINAVLYYNLCAVNNSQLKRNVQLILSNEASILNVLKVKFQNHVTRSSKPDGRPAFWENAVKALQEIKPEWDHNLPNSPAKLKKKLLTYCKNGYESLLNDLN